MDRITSPFGGQTTTREVATGLASTCVWAVIGDELEGNGGLYLENCAQAVPWNADQPWAGVMPHALDKAAADRLWALSQETTGA